MFLSEEDYKIVIDDKAFDIISQSDQTSVGKAEETAIEEISSYLRGRYNVADVFSSEGEERNAIIVMFCADITLYHLISSTPGKMGLEIREKRYERAVEWLQGVQGGKIVPDLPGAQDDSGENILSTSWGNSDNKQAW